MKSILIHDGLNIEHDNGEIIVDGVTPFDMFVRIEYETGICGEGWSEYRLCEAGTDIENWSWDLAKEHAESYGHYDDGYDEETGFDPNNISAMVYWYSPEFSSGRINGGSPNSEIYKELVKRGVISELGNYISPEIAELLYFENDGELRRFLAHQ